MDVRRAARIGNRQDRAEPERAAGIGAIDAVALEVRIAFVLARTLYDKLWDEHVVHTEETAPPVLYIDRHLVHEVTSPQAFEGLRLAGRKVWRISSIVATADHNTPTTGWELGYDGIADPISRSRSRRWTPTSAPSAPRPTSPSSTRARASCT
jgi:hypothetical protein